MMLFCVIQHVLVRIDVYVHQGELFPRVGFIVTNMNAKSQCVDHFYNGRGCDKQGNIYRDIVPD